MNAARVDPVTLLKIKKSKRNQLLLEQYSGDKKETTDVTTRVKIDESEALLNFIVIIAVIET